MASSQFTTRNSRGKLNLLKCNDCRRDKKGCLPVNRQWPTKCNRCETEGLPCSQNTKKERKRKNMGQITKSPARAQRLGINTERLIMSLTSGSLVEQGNFPSDRDLTQEHGHTHAHSASTSWELARNQQSSSASTDINALISLSTSDSNTALSCNRSKRPNIWELLYEPTYLSSVASNSPHVTGIGFYMRQFISRNTRSPMPSDMNSLAHHASLQRALCTLLPLQLITHNLGKLSCDQAIVYTTIYQLVNDLVPLQWNIRKDQHQWKLDKRYAPIQIVMSYLQNGGAQTAKRIKSICDAVPAPFRDVFKRRMLDFAAKASVHCVVEVLLEDVPANEVFNFKNPSLGSIIRSQSGSKIWRAVLINMVSIALQMIGPRQSQMFEDINNNLKHYDLRPCSADGYELLTFVFNYVKPFEILSLDKFIASDDRRILQHLLDTAAEPKSSTFQDWIENRNLARSVAKALSEANSSWMFDTILRVLPKERKYDQPNFESGRCHTCLDEYEIHQELGSTPRAHFSHYLSDALCIAVHHTHWTTAELLLIAGVRPKACCLIAAVHEKNIEMVNLLLKASTNPNALVAATLMPCRGHHLPRYLMNIPYVEAIRSGSVEICSMFASLEPENFQNITSMLACLFAASEVGDGQLVDKYMSLIQRRSSQDRQESNGENDDLHHSLRGALRWAIGSRCEFAVAKLLDAGALVKQADILLALELRHKAILHRLLGYTGEMCKDDLEQDEVSESNLRKMLIEAVHWEDISIIDHLLRYGIFEPYMQSALRAAFSMQNQAIVNKILDHGIAFNRATPEAEPLLEYLIFNANPECINDWLHLGLCPASGLIPAIASRNYGIIHLFVQATSKRYPNGNAPHAVDALVRAVESGDTGILRLVAGYFRKSLDLRRYSKTCRHLTRGLHKAILVDGPEINRAMQILLESGADPNSIEYYDYKSLVEVEFLYAQTPLTLAITKSSVDMVDLLLQHNADINMTTKWGLKRTPLQLATEISTHSMVKHLWEMGADINAPAAIFGGATALQLAAIRGDTRIAEFLLSKGADLLTAPAKRHGRTPFEGAAEHGRVDMMIFLVEHAGRQGIDLFQDGEEQVERAIKFADANRQFHTKRMAEDMLDKVREQKSYEQIVQSWDTLRIPQQMHWYT